MNIYLNFIFILFMGVIGASHELHAISSVPMTVETIKTRSATIEA